MGPRLMLMGPTLAMGDHKILELIQKAGGQVVIEEFAEGIKTYRHQVKISDDLMASLAEAYFMDRAVPAWFRPATGRMEHLVSLAKDFNVDGVICYQLLYRDCDKLESYYLPEIFRKEAGVSMLTLESDYDPGETGQLQTRIESYIESIEG
jgi:benzoyl-CoA reductase/2-hydroxyglutaryl-CoA dehydratase subunit BcrC/BadD/HgdB